jgi:glycosyltransferase involved in cell wall biosynthesis
MRVGIVAGRDTMMRGDSPQDYACHLAAALGEQGHEVTLYVRRRGKRRRAERGYRVVEARVGPDTALTSPETLPLVGDFAKFLNNRWLIDRPDVVHAHGWVPGLAAQLAARHQELPVVQSFHGLATMHPTDGEVPAEQLRLEPLLARSAAWVAASFTAELSTLARFRHGRTRLSVVPSGVDVDRFNPVGQAAPREYSHRILCVGPNTLSTNGFDEAIRALPWVPDSELVVAETDPEDVADADSRGDLQRLAENLGVVDRVRLLGAVAPGQLPALMRSADVVACTPRSAPAATVALQAMASGTAVVATAVDALADIVVHGVTGLLVSPGRPRELIGALKTLQSQPFRCQGMGAAGRARVRSCYTWDRIAADSEAIYSKISYASRMDDVVSAKDGIQAS